MERGRVNEVIGEFLGYMEQTPVRGGWRDEGDSLSHDSFMVRHEHARTRRKPRLGLRKVSEGVCEFTR